MDFTQKIIDWYVINKRDLPWRNTSNPYNIWLSEIILQQTQIKQGLPYYEAFLECFPNVFDLANAKESEVLKLWQGLGYYSRARNLHHTAKFIVSELNGIFPNNHKDLLKLKGVGDYTASAIASICFNEVTAVVDGNVYRLLSRYFGIETPINTSKGFKEFKALAQKLIDSSQPATFNQSIMEFGARQCKPKSPDCNSCPLNTNCVALNNNSISKLPVKLKAQPVKKRYFNYIVIISSDNKTLFNERKGKGIWQNLYEFPLIETQKSINETIVIEEIKLLKITNSHSFSVVQFNEKEIVHKLSHQHLYVKFWVVSLETKLKNGISTQKLKTYPVPILIGNFIEQFNF